MAFFEEQEVLSSFEAFKISELEKGKSIGFYFSGMQSRSNDKGDFEVCEGVRFNLSAKNIDELVASAITSSFVPNTMLKNLIDSKSFSIGFCYRIEKAWDIGDKGRRGNPAKGYGYKVFKLAVPSDIVAKLQEVLGQNAATADFVEEEIGFEKPNL